MTIEIALLLIVIGGQVLVIQLLRDLLGIGRRLENSVASLRTHRDDEVKHLRDQVKDYQQQVLALADAATQIRLAKQRGEIKTEPATMLPTRAGRTTLRVMTPEVK